MKDIKELRCFPLQEIIYVMISYLIWETLNEYSVEERQSAFMSEIIELGLYYIKPGDEKDDRCNKHDGDPVTEQTML